MRGSAKRPVTRGPTSNIRNRLTSHETRSYYYSEELYNKITFVIGSGYHSNIVQVLLVGHPHIVLNMPPQIAINYLSLRKM